jgi:hypothetical protein
MNPATWQCQYKVENGIIRSPGKFEGEAEYVPYFWDSVMEGGGDFEARGDIIGCYITPEEKLRFPTLRRRRTVKLYERDDGFVCEV